MFFLERDSYYDINLRFVLALRAIGKGYTAGKTFCALMNLPPPRTKHAKLEKVLGSAIEVVGKQSMERAVAEAVEENEGSRDLAVALDGTWQKRGFQSLNGIVCATSVDTGKVLDVCVLSKYCLCPNKLRNEHVSTCIANYKGTSGGMTFCSKLNNLFCNKYVINFFFF